MKEVKQGIYSTGGHSNKQEKERGRQGGQVYTKEDYKYAWRYAPACSINFRRFLVVIGASLSEPHTSVTALRTRVYLWTDHLP